MRTTGGGVTLFVLLFVVAACVAASSVQASKGVRYGIQDDAWLEFGPGTLDQRLATFKRLGVPLVRFTLHWNEIARRRPKDPTSPRDRAYDWRRPDRVLRGLRRHGLTPVLTLVGTPAWANGGRSPNFAPPRPRDFRSFATCRRQALPVGSLLADLERAEQAPLAQADEVGDLRPASAQPWVRGDPCRAATRSGRRRRDRASWRVGRRRTGRLGPRHGSPPTRSSTPTPTTRTPRRRPRRRPAAAAVTALRSRWRRSGSSSSSSGAPSGRSRSGSPSTATSRIRRTRSWAFRSRGRRTLVSLAAMRAWRLPRVTMLIQYLYRDEVVLSRFQTGLVFANDRCEALAAGIQAAVRADAATRVSDSRLGSDPRRTARAEAVPAGGAPQERVEGGRATTG